MYEMLLSLLVSTVWCRAFRIVCFETSFKEVLYDGQVVHRTVVCEARHSFPERAKAKLLPPKYGIERPNRVKTR